MADTRIIVLLNLKPGKSRTDYEEWARTVDLPTVNRLRSVDRFDVYETTGMLGSSEAAPYQYIEVLDVADMGLFGTEVSTDVMKAVAAAFQNWADPLFVTTRALTWDAAK